MSLKGGTVMGSLVRKLKEAWESYLRKLTRANRESFGGGRMDCCGLKKASDRKTGA